MKQKTLKPIGKAPLCKCGCRGRVKWNKWHKYWPEYILGHCRRNKHHTAATKAKMRKSAKTGKSNPLWTGGKTKKFCKICGKIFFSYNGKSCRLFYCSLVCEKIFRSRKWQKENNPNWIGGKPERICETCGEQFQSYYQGRFCSKNCESKWQKTQTGEKSNTWKGGISKLPYSQDWTETLRKSIRQRDNYTCQLCGKNQKKNGAKLPVHHIDYDKENCNPENLITLCRACNSKVNGSRKEWAKFFRRKLKFA